MVTVCGCTGAAEAAISAVDGCGIGQELAPGRDRLVAGRRRETPSTLTTTLVIGAPAAGWAATRPSSRSRSRTVWSTIVCGAPSWVAAVAAVSSASAALTCSSVTVTPTSFGGDLEQLAADRRRGLAPVQLGQRRGIRAGSALRLRLLRRLPSSGRRSPTRRSTASPTCAAEVAGVAQPAAGQHRRRAATQACCSRSRWRRIRRAESTPATFRFRGAAGRAAHTLTPSHSARRRRPAPRCGPCGPRAPAHDEGSTVRDARRPSRRATSSSAIGQ